MFVGAGANADYRTHDERDELDGWHVSLSPIVRYALDSRTLLEVGPQLKAVDARADHRASRLVGIGAGVSHAFSDGLSASISTSFQHQRYRANDPLFAMRREDETAWLSARLLHRSLHHGGFAPYVGYSYERRRSNIALHDYDNHGVIVGLTREF